MDEKSLRTSVFQRVIILVIAILLLGSMVLTYMFIVMGNNTSNTSGSDDSDAEIDAILAEYDETVEKVQEEAKELSEKYFDTFKGYRSAVKAYNEATATNSVLDTKDLKEGTGRKIEGDDDFDYLAYYIGWCADGSVFDSSFEVEEDEESDEIDLSTATGLLAPMNPSENLIEGWRQGMIDMKLGGVREITMSGDLAYGDSREICGGMNKPLKFIVMTIPRDGEIAELYDSLSELEERFYAAYYGSM